MRTSNNISQKAMSLALAVVAMTILAAAVGQAQSTTLYKESAYGSSAYVGNMVTVAQTAPVNVGGDCGNALVGLQQSGTVAGVSAVPVLTTGVVNTYAASTENTSYSTSEVNGISLLGGLISGDTIVAASTTTIGPHLSLSYSGAGSSVVNLRVLGIPINFVPAPNTTITIPLIGRIVLNEQIVSTGPGYATFTVNMIHVYVTLSNLLGIRTGTEVVVASASSGILILPGTAAVGGFSYGSQVTGSLVQSNQTAPILIVCRGTNGVTLANTLAGVTIPNIASTGTITDTGVANVAGRLSYSTTTDNIQGVNLLGGMVTANAINAQANGITTDDVNLQFTTSGSFVGLSVVGHPEINDNVPANTTVPILGLGTLYIHHTIVGDHSAEVRMIELVVNQTNILGLPVGEDITIGAAQASLHTGLHP